MAKQLIVHGTTATPFVWNRMTMIHLAHDPKVVFGLRVTSLCGHNRAVGIGGGVRPTAEFLTMHSSAVCALCRTILEHDGKVE